MLGVVAIKQQGHFGNNTQQGYTIILPSLMAGLHNFQIFSAPWILTVRLDGPRMSRGLSCKKDLTKDRFNIKTWSYQHTRPSHDRLRLILGMLYLKNVLFLYIKTGSKSLN